MGSRYFRLYRMVHPDDRRVTRAKMVYIEGYPAFSFFAYQMKDHPMDIGDHQSTTGWVVCELLTGRFVGRSYGREASLSKAIANSKAKIDKGCSGNLSRQDIFRNRLSRIIGQHGIANTSFNCADLETLEKTK